MINRKQWLEQLRRDLIVDPVLNDPRSTNGSRLGRTVEWCFRHAIGGGQADFDKPIEDLSPRDRVMLYAFFNQKAHIDELIHAFTKLANDIESIRNATVVDIGCGPFTAGLALANVVGSQSNFRYFGVDRAESMRLLGNDLAAAVASKGELNDQTRISFHQSVDEIDFGKRRAAEITVIVLSYLLASDTIDVEALVDEIVRACDRIGLGKVVVLYTNTAREVARQNYPHFREKMIRAGFTVHIEETEHFEDTDKPRDIHYALLVRPPVSIPISEFKR